MAEISEYEQIRLKNIEENRRMLCQLGLLSEDWKPPVPKVFKPGFIKKPIKKRTKVENGDPLYLPGRRSLRTSHSNDTDDSDFTDSINGEYSGSENAKEKRPKRPNVYGEIEDVHVGDMWETRIECSRAGIHRPTVAGIHPGPEGAYSIALSGGYEDNYDGGDSFTYTGAGGRDLKGTKDKPKNLRTGPQVKDQTLDGANGSLATSVETRKPVRVIRGYKSSSAYAPDFGYRYDGLYQVENYWTAKGASGHLVYKFALKRCSDQEPPPWIAENETDTSKVEETHENIAADTDETSKNALNSSTRAGKKVSDEELNLQNKTENVSGGSINGSIHSPNVDKGQTEKLTPEKCNVIDKTVSSGSSSVSKSQKKISSKNSPLKVKSSSLSDNSYKSPAKMIASNQSLDELATSKDDNAGVCLNDKVQKQLDDSSQKTAVTQEINDSDFSVNNKSVPENGKLVSNETSPDIFEGSSPGYLKSRNRENPFIFGRNRGVKRSPSPDDFAKICDELCNDLPKIEKVKRLRFSFDNFPDDDLQINTSKTRRKRMSHTPRKSSLIVNKGVKDNYNQNGSDLLFSKYIEICLTKFSFSENDYLGWDDYSCEFEGWTDKEVNEAKKYTSSFSDFIFKCHENNSFSSADENGWAGWEDVPRRSLILNGFLLDKISRNRKSCDSDGTDVPDEFLGFQQQEVVN